jgi:hypothetical protein
MDLDMNAEGNPGTNGKRGLTARNELTMHPINKSFLHDAETQCGLHSADCRPLALYSLK